MKSRVFTPFLAAFAGSIILLIGLFLLQGTQTSRTILSGSSVAQAAQVAATTDLTVTFKVDKVTVAANDTVNFTVLVTTSNAFSKTTYLLEIKFGDGSTSELKNGLSGSIKTPLTIAHKYASVGSFTVQASAYTTVGTPALDQKTLQIAVSDKVLMNLPASPTFYVGQVIPFSVTGTTANVIYEIGSWKSSPFPPPSIARFPITQTGTLKFAVKDAVSKAELVSGSAQVNKPAVALPAKTLSASANTPVEIGTPKITPAPGTTVSYIYNCGNGTPPSGSKCTYANSGTFTARVTATVDYDSNSLKNPVYAYDFPSNVSKIELGSDSATVTVGGVVPTPTPTITPTGKSTIKIIVGKADLKACGDTTVITAEVKDSNGKPLPSASAAVTFTVTDKGSGTQIRIPANTGKITTTNFVTTGPGNVIIKAVLKSTPTISATEERLIGPTGDERQCTLKAKPPEGGDPRGTDHRIDGDDNDANFKRADGKPAFKFFFFIRPGHPDFTDVKFVRLAYNPICEAKPITTTKTVTNVTSLVCFLLKLLKEDGTEKTLDKFSEPVSFTIDLNPAAWDKAKKHKEAKPNGKVIKIYYQDTLGDFAEDSSAVVDETNLKETSTTSTTLMLQQTTATDPSIIVSTTSAGETAVGVDTSSVVVDTGNKVYLPLILKAPTTATTSTLALTR